MITFLVTSRLISLVRVSSSSFSTIACRLCNLHHCHCLYFCLRLGRFILGHLLQLFGLVGFVLILWRQVVLIEHHDDQRVEKVWEG